jgi:hypothetical protein
MPSFITKSLTVAESGSTTSARSPLDPAGKYLRKLASSLTLTVINLVLSNVRCEAR